jgi:hypothetical protein
LFHEGIPFTSETKSKEPGGIRLTQFVSVALKSQFNLMYIDFFRQKNKTLKELVTFFLSAKPTQAYVKQKMSTFGNAWSVCV